MASGRTKIQWQGWVVVCDGAKALLLRNDGDADLPNLKTVEVFSQPHPPSRELGSDRPGRVYQSHDTGRSGTEQRDLHTEAENSFIAMVADAVDKAAHAHSMKSLIVVAPPKALGVLRERLTPAVRAIVVAEIAKDLARLSTAEIEKHLSE